MDKFLVVKSINPGLPASNTAASVKPVATSTPTVVAPTTPKKKVPAKPKDDDKENSSTSVNINSTVPAPTTAAPPTTPKKKQPSSDAKKDTKKNATTTDNKPTSTTNQDGQQIKATSSTATPTNTTEEKKEVLHQTCVTNFFKPMSGDVPIHKYLFEKEAADRAERERIEKERLEKEEEELRIKKAEERKRKAELKKKRDEEKRKREEEEWEEYQLIQERRTKGVEIIPGLYLGSFVAAKNEEWLLEKNVKRIVNVTSEVKCYFLDKNQDEDNEEDDEEEEEEEEGNVDKEDGEEIDNKEVKDNDSKDQENAPVVNDNSPKIEEETKQEGIDPSSTTTPTASSLPNEQQNEDKDDTKSDKVEEKKKEEEKDVVIEDSKEDNLEKDGASKMDEDNNNNNLPKLEIEYFRIAIADSSKSPIENYFNDACDFIDQVLKERDDTTSDSNSIANQSFKNVLVHCKQGRSRSPSIIMAYLIRNKKWTLEKAWNHVSSTADKSLTVNDGFKTKLMDFEMKIHGTQSLDFFASKTRSEASGATSSRFMRSLENLKTKRAAKQQQIEQLAKNPSYINEESDRLNDCIIDDEEDDVDADGETVGEEDMSKNLDELKIVKKRRPTSFNQLE